MTRCDTLHRAGGAARRVSGRLVCDSVRAAVIRDTYVSRQAVEHDDVNVACRCLGPRPRIVEDVRTAFLEARVSTDPDFRRRVKHLSAMAADAQRRPGDGRRSEGAR